MIEKKIKIECEQWTRSVGYYQKVSNFNPGKQQEFRDRLPYKVPK